MLNKAIQSSINTLDKLRIKTTLADTAQFFDAKLVDKLNTAVNRQYDRVAEVAKRQGFKVLTGEEYYSVTEVDVDTINDLLKAL